MFKVGDKVVARNNLSDSYERLGGHEENFASMQNQICTVSEVNLDDSDIIIVEFVDYIGEPNNYSVLASDFKLHRKPTVVIGAL